MMKNKKSIFTRLLTMITALTLFSVPIAIAVPVLQSGPDAPSDISCQSTMSSLNTFTASRTVVRAGIACTDTAKVTMYECKFNDCNDLEEADWGYKVKGVLPEFKGFVVGNMYGYKCNECPETNFVSTTTTTCGGTTTSCPENGGTTTTTATTGNCPITVTEGELVKIQWLGSDPDPDVGPQGKLTYNYTGVLGADGTWQTMKGDAGIHTAKAQVFDGEFSDSTEFCIEVLKANQPAELSLGTENVFVDEGETVVLSATCADPDNDATFIGYSGWMNSNSRVTNYDDAGTYEVVVSCVDSKGEGESRPVNITVYDVNRAPVLTVHSDSITVNEGETVQIGATCNDADSDATEITYSGWMTASTKPTELDDSGTYEVTVTCTDSKGAVDSDIVTITVMDTNQPAELDVPATVTVYESERVVLDAKCSDPDNDATTLTYSGWMTTSAKTTTYDDAGTYSVTVSCMDSNGLGETQQVTVTVLNKNRPPQITWTRLI